MLLHTADRSKNGLACLLALPECNHIKRELTERERSGGGRNRHEEVRAIKCSRAHERQPVGPHGTLDGQRLVLAIECLAKCSIAIEKLRSEPEKLYFFGVIVVCQHIFQIIKAPRVR